MALRGHDGRKQQGLPVRGRWVLHVHQAAQQHHPVVLKASGPPQGARRNSTGTQLSGVPPSKAKSNRTMAILRPEAVEILAAPELLIEKFQAYTDAPEAQIL